MKPVRAGASNLGVGEDGQEVSGQSSAPHITAKMVIAKISINRWSQRPCTRGSRKSPKHLRKTWSAPTVIASTDNEKVWIAYAVFFEAEPGVFWICTGQGKHLRQLY